MRFIILIVYLSFISCSSYKQFKTSNQYCLFNDSIFSLNNLDLVLSEKIYLKIKSEKHFVLHNDNEKKIEFISLSKGRVLKVITNKKIKIQKTIGYYSNRKIRFFSNSLVNNDFNIYIYKHFDNKGNITKMIDHEKGYKICWAEMIAIMKKRYRSLIRKYEIHTFNLSRVNLNDFPEAKPRWTITMEGNEAYEQKGYDEGHKHYSFDGVTGEYLYTSTSRSVYD